MNKGIRIILNQLNPKYIQALIQTQKGEKVLRMWPLPLNQVDRQRNLLQAMSYCRGLVSILPDSEFIVKEK